jgi:hypothetical protein
LHEDQIKTLTQLVGESSHLPSQAVKIETEQNPSQPNTALNSQKDTSVKQRKSKLSLKQKIAILSEIYQDTKLSQQEINEIQQDLV